MESKWISVKDSLPENFKQVLIFVEFYDTVLNQQSNKIEISHRLLDIMYTNKDVWYGYYRPGYRLPEECIKYWMPLPETPKKD